MRNVVLGLVGLLLVGFSIGWLVWHERTAVIRAVALQTQLNTATAANESLTATLEDVQKNQAEDRRQVLELSGELERIVIKQQATKSKVAKVVEDAAPSDQDLLNRKLPAAVLGLLPTGPRAADRDAHGAAEPAG